MLGSHRLKISTFADERCGFLSCGKPVNNIFKCFSSAAFVLLITPKFCNLPGNIVFPQDYLKEYLRGQKSKRFRCVLEKAITREKEMVPSNIYIFQCGHCKLYFLRWKFDQSNVPKTHFDLNR